MEAIKFFAIIALVALTTVAAAQTVPPVVGTLPPNLLGNYVGGTLVPQIGCGSSKPFDFSAAGSSELLPAGTGIYICGYALEMPLAGAGTVELDYGTGVNCATTPVKMTPGWTASVVDHSHVYRGLGAPAGQAVCLKRSANVPVQFILYYTRF